MKSSYNSLKKWQKISICSIGLLALILVVIGTIFFKSFFIIGLSLMISGAILFIINTIIWIIFEFINKKSSQL